MKATLIAGAAFAALLAAPAFAETAPTGYVGLEYGRSNIDVGALDDDFDAWGVNGAVAFDAGALGVQLDAAYGNSDDADSYSANAHLFTRNESYLLGGFVGVFDGDGSETAYVVGAEAQKYFDDVTLAGVLAYGDSDDNTLDGVWGLGGEVRYFVNDNFKLSGGLGWADADADKVWSAGVGGEYQFSAAPVSVYVNYARSEFDKADVSVDTFGIGVRYAFGGTTLKSRDRSGAGLSGASTVFGGLF